jgi:flagellar hook-associated protein 2
MVTSPSSLNRITGLASGMDIDAMVKKLMTAERIPLDKITANKQKLSWKQDAVRTLNVSLQTFNTGTQAMRLQSTFGMFTSTSTDATVVTGKGTGSGSDAVAQFSNITMLATTASTSTSNAGGLDGDPLTKIDPTALMSTSLGLPAGSTTFSLNALQKDGTYKATTVTYDPSVDSLDAVLTRLNNSGAGVTAFYDSGSDKVVLSNNTTGKGTGVAGTESLQLTSGTFFTRLGLSTVDNGTNAAFDINGITTTRQSNTVSINGNEYTLLKATASAIPVNVEIKRDADGIVTKVKDFIEKYNTMLDTLNTKSNEATYRDYQPLTDDQKTAMKDADILAWETKAKSGNLSNDTNLQQAIYGFRSDIYSTVNGLPTGVLNQLTALGITTDAYQNGGKLVLTDETKLRAAISQSPDQVTALFTNHDTTDPTKDGLAWKLYSRANATISKFTTVAGTSNSVYDNSQISKSITSLNTDIDNFNIKLQAKETRYYAKFTAMETAIAQLTSQSASITSLTGG